MPKRAAYRLSVAAVVVSCGAAVGSAQSIAQVDFGPLAVEAAVPLRGGVERLVVAEPGAAVSVAWRLNGDRADIAGVAPAPTAGYVVKNRVIVETSDRAGLSRAVNARAAVGAAMVTAAPVRGFSFVETGTVGEAVALAEALRATGAYRSVEVDIERPRALRGVLPTDPLFGNQWHLRNTQNTIADINAEGAWALGYTGAGVTVGVTESAWQTGHPDLAANYNAAASQGSGNSGHATSVAGVIAGVADNGIGVSGIAFGAQVSSLIIGSASQTAAAFLYRNDLNDIKNDSWGPWDSGEMWDQYASSIELAALEECALLGRNGLGTMTAWAAGNGGTQDRVDYDPYTSSRYTFAIGAIGDQDREADYNELGSSMLVVAHSSGNSRSITTTTSGSNYTSFFGGTSSASPLGAGALALALEANPGLTWRDVQALLVETARKNDPADSFWTTNAAGHDISYRFGFGAIDAAALVTAAAGWVNLPEEASATSGFQNVSASIPDNNTAGLTRTVEISEDLIVEQVVLNLNVTTLFVGDLRVTLTSPSGTESVFATPRSFDSSDNITNYDFLSYRPWGESSAGTWTVKVSDERASNSALWQNFTVTVYGVPAAAGCNAADVVEPFDVLDLADLQAFAGAFVGQEPLADIAEPFGVWDLADVQLFAGTFTGGCP